MIAKIFLNLGINYTKLSINDFPKTSMLFHLKNLEITFKNKKNNRVTLFYDGKNFHKFRYRIQKIE